MEGHPTNQSMATILGCSFNCENIVSHFKHPNKEQNVYVIFDACHLMKIFCGMLNAYKEVFESSIGTARWVDICRLEALQSEESLRAVNK